MRHSLRCNCSIMKFIIPVLSGRICLTSLFSVSPFSSARLLNRHWLLTYLLALPFRSASISEKLTLKISFQPTALFADEKNGKTASYSITEAPN